MSVKGAPCTSMSFARGAGIAFGKVGGKMTSGRVEREDDWRE
jgi:hypothetical protein